MNVTKDGYLQMVSGKTVSVAIFRGRHRILGQIHPIQRHFVMGVWNLAGIKYSYVYIAINALMKIQTNPVQGVFFLDQAFY